MLNINLKKVKKYSTPVTCMVLTCDLQSKMALAKKKNYKSKNTAYNIFPQLRIEFILACFFLSITNKISRLILIF